MGVSCSCLSSRRNLASYTSSSTHRPTAAEASESENSAGAIEERIERSKSHWSQLSEFELNAGEVAELSNVHVFRSLQSHPNWGTFFRTFGKDSRIGELVMGQKFAEGGQAELYDAVIHWNEPHIQKEHMERRTKWALKVFKKGSSLRQLQLQWPRGMLQNHWERTEEQRRGLLPEARLQGDVVYGILLEDGRFAFLMVKEDEDLRHQIDRLMLTTRENCCPYSKMEVEDIMWRVAYGMEWMHSRDIIHRDLKASNVLCTEVENGSRTFDVADFECSIGVIGTGFFRAPEILRACKDYSIHSKPELFTKAADVYSYGMLCYEILTGKLPFADYGRTDFDHVLTGERPDLPKYVDRWLRGLLRRCWQSNPAKRPSFREIRKIISANSERCRELDTYINQLKVERAMGIRTLVVRRAS